MTVEKEEKSMAINLFARQMNGSRSRDQNQESSSLRHPVYSEQLQVGKRNWISSLESFSKDTASLSSRKMLRYSNNVAQNGEGVSPYTRKHVSSSSEHSRDCVLHRSYLMGQKPT